MRLPGDIRYNCRAAEIRERASQAEEACRTVHGYRPAMHVLFIGPFPWPSHQGSQLYLSGQMQALRSRGHRVTLATYGTDQAPPDSHTIRSPRLNRWPRGGGLHPLRPVHDVWLARRIARWAQDASVDVVHAHNVEGPFIARRARISAPLVYDLHTEMRVELGHHLPRGLRRLGPWVGKHLDQQALRDVDAGCAISQNAAEVFAQHQLPHQWVGPCSVDSPTCSDDARERLHLPARYVAYAGNLDGYQDLSRMYVASRSWSAPLVVVTHSLAPVPEDVRVIRTSRLQDVFDVLGNATVAVAPRLACAGFPMKLLNHLALGVPTVAMRAATDPIPGIIRSTPSQFEHDVERVLRHFHLQQRLATDARAAAEHFHPTAQARRLETLYALAQRAHRSRC